MSAEIVAIIDQPIFPSKVAFDLYAPFQGQISNTQSMAINCASGDVSKDLFTRMME
jgi:hypothetical protein